MIASPNLSSVGAAAPLFEVERLSVAIKGLSAVEDVSFAINAGQTMALVGESGCGKSLTALAIVGLLPDVAERRHGTVRLMDHLLSELAPESLRAMRGTAVSMIFQEPAASLNPLMRVGEQVAETLVVHGRATRPEARATALGLLAAVGIPDPEIRARQYPFELSGGMCQRVMIAIALVAQPKLLIADEPTTALDVTIQAQILDLLRRLRAEHNTTLLLITHDMGVVSDIADKVCVMYAGRIVEEADVEALFERQYHPYTRLLLRTIPTLDGRRKTLLPTIRGNVPDLAGWPKGCRFAPRCPLADSRCALDAPPLVALDSDPQRKSACWHAEKVMERIR